MKKITLMALILLAIATGGYAQGAQESGPEPIGITARIDYYSTYLWRGTYFFGGDGAFCPQLTYNVLGSGAVASFIGEFSESYFFEGEKKDRNQTAFAYHGLDFGIDYSHTFNEAFTVGAGLWYYWYFNSGEADASNSTDYSFLTAKGFVRADMLPLKPTATLYYDYYTAIERGGDFYVTLGVSHEFSLSGEVTLGISLSTGYYYQNTAETTTYTGTEIIETPVKKGFSDISTLVTLNYKKGSLGVFGGFGYVVVPAETWHKGQDVHRFYATFGASYTL